jgi:hypothetical protein
MAIKIPTRLKPPANADSKADAFIAKAGAKPEAPPEGRRSPITLRFDTALLKKIDAAAKRQGINRTAWLHVAASNALDEKS